MATTLEDKVITQETLKKAFTWYDYQRLLATLVEEHKTTGPDQSAKFVEFTSLNQQRIKRIGKTVTLKPELIQVLQDLPIRLKWVVLIESWCGDVANNLPIINMMTDASPNIELYVLIRDENPEIMDTYLTNGARSIPKLICLDENLNELGTWGPKPEPLMQLLQEYKFGPEPRMTHDEFIRQTQLWYVADKGQTIQNEFLQLIKSWID